MRPLQPALRALFHLLYHPFARTYDLVAATVSLGRWTTWIKAVLPYVEGTHVLELGHGPGHLQRSLRDLGLIAVGLDESRQMGSLAAKRLARHGYPQTNLTRGLSQQLPFPAATFQTVVATFPSEYLLDPRTLGEVYRVLSPSGRFVVLPAAWLTGRGLTERFMAWLFRITGQAAGPVGAVNERLIAHFAKAGFQVSAERIDNRSSTVLIVLASKPA
ncbi:MAG: class I SAM-dependent methyltransferase [Chloroflexi bacterium]|nr:class I SAM-dependent methyltransferase [Chloroflexota bacterium]